jgi:hypothetical protein
VRLRWLGRGAKWLRLVPLVERKNANGRDRGCAATVAVIAADQLVRPNRTLGTVSTSCASRDECDAALVARACELHADAVVVGNYRTQREPQYQPAPGQDPKRLRNSEAPRMESVGPSRQLAADGRLVVWLD